jgi:hypothetical protein
MKNLVFFYIRTHFVPQRGHNTSRYRAQPVNVISDLGFHGVTMKSAVFGDVTKCASGKNRSFRGMYRFHHKVDKNRRARNNVSSF